MKFDLEILYDDNGNKKNYYNTIKNILDIESIHGGKDLMATLQEEIKLGDKDGESVPRFKKIYLHNVTMTISPNDKQGIVVTGWQKNGDDGPITGQVWRLRRPTQEVE